MNKILLFENGACAVFTDGKQNGKAQSQGWIISHLKWLESIGIDLKEYEIIMPNGKFCKPFKLSDGTWNWEVK